MLLTAPREIVLLRTGPSEGTWRRLMEMIDERRAAGEELAPVVEALRPELGRWPEELRRTLPLHWTYRLAARGRLPEAALANDLVLSDRWALTHFDDFRPLVQADNRRYQDTGDEYEGVEADERTEVERLFGSPDLAGIRRLDLSYVSDGNPYSPGPMVSLTTTQELFAAPFLPRLRALLLGNALCWRDPIAVLAELLKRAPELRELDLRENELDGHALVRLAGCPELAQLERLRLDEDRLGRTVRHAFVRAGLERLIADIDECEGEDE